jgi:predicted ester cyclase
VVARSIVSGTQKAEFMGIPATGKKIKFSAIGIFRMTGGKVVESWSLLDTVGIMQQLGVGPKTPKL